MNTSILDQLLAIHAALPKPTVTRICVIPPPMIAVPARPHRQKRIHKKWLRRHGWTSRIDPAVDPMKSMRVGTDLYIYTPAYLALKRAAGDGAPSLLHGLPIVRWDA